MTRKVAIAGVGYTDLSRKSGRSVLDLATEAAMGACTDAGLPPSAIDGIASFMVSNDSEPCESLATALALPGLRYVMDANGAGQSPCHLVGNATMAIATGAADHVLVFRALNGRSGVRVGASRFAGKSAPYRYPIGYNAYMMYIAMWARRFLHETGQGEQDLAAVAVAQRAYAELNDRAILRTPLTYDGYFASRRVVDPFRLPDCTTEVDGACAVLLTSLDRARDLRRPPAVVAAHAYRAGARPGLDIGNHTMVEDYTRNFTALLREDLYAAAGISTGDVDFAQIYDCFTSTVLMGLEGLGLCERGESGAFVRSGATGLGGSLPVNTNGGLLSEGYVHGMNTVAEAVLQIQGRGGERQSARHDVGVVTSGALIDGSALVLTSDR
ncbi:lipid-transfer protein [Streptomyces sp. LN785]|uniref:thiolase C-terminal domain-containing protein n=1 Tax=Streptomyces sp. LN785 TaxID=3112983 RepID=UPI00371FE015